MAVQLISVVLYRGRRVSSAPVARLVRRPVTGLIEHFTGEGIIPSVSHEIKYVTATRSVKRISETLIK